MVFAGSAAFAVPSLRALREAGHQIQLVITQPDRPAGRGMKLRPSPVKLAAKELSLSVFQPEKIRDPEAVEHIRSLAPDLLVVVAYGQIIPRLVLSIPRLRAINVHASLLPRWRGAAPIARSILAGDAETGVTILQMDEQLDHGPILASEATMIGEHEDAPALTSRLAVLGAELLVETLDRVESIEPREQDHARASVASKLTKEEGELDWGMDPREIDRRVRGLQPWPGATLPSDRGRVKVLRGHVEGNRYVLDTVQLPGKKPMPAKQVLGDV